MIKNRLSGISPEEREILQGRQSIDRSIYMDGSRDVISGEKLLEKGKLIAIRPHTRFIAFPEHSHDYVEMVYMCAGQTRHVVNGKPLTLRQGELLMLGQNARQSIEPAGERDLAVNIIVRPAFFSGTLPYLGEEETPLRSFIVSSLTNKRGILQMTMGLLFAQLMNHTEALQFETQEQNAVVSVLRYIEDRYRDGSLTEIAEALHYELPSLSRLIRQRTGKNYTELLQEKRLSQAAWLLRNTDKKVEEIANAVGYENLSYFHRLFAGHFGQSPKKYRDCK